MSARRKSKAAAAAKPREKRIVSSWTETQANHRGDFRTCPYCEYRTNDIDDWRQWDSLLVLEPRFYKASAVVVASECPKCFELSWVHATMSYIRTYLAYPEAWEKVVEEKEARMRLEALREWGAGICHRCRHLRSGTIEYHAWRDCVIGSGPPMKQCSRFEAYVPPKGAA